MAHRPNQAEEYALWEQYNPRTGHWISDAKDIVLRFLQDFFFQQAPGEGCFHWEPARRDTLAYQTDEKETELVITDNSPVNTDSVGKRPLIILSRGPFAYGNTSLDQLRHEDFRTGKRTHTDLLTGSFVLNCLSAEGLEAERLAVMVAKAINIYRRLLQKAGFFHIGTQIQIGSESPPGALLSGDSNTDWVNVPVTFPVYYQEEWTYQKNAELLQSMFFKVQAIFRNFDGSIRYPDAINPDGSVNEDSDGVIVAAWTVTAPPEAP